MSKIEFDSDRCEGQEAIVVSFDICGFSEFCSHAEAYRLLNKYMSALFDEVDRLQDHCPEAGFTMNAALQPTCFPSLKHCRAIDVKGVREVPIIMFQNDW